jgi:hypothetical protein
MANRWPLSAAITHSLVRPQDAAINGRKLGLGLNKHKHYYYGGGGNSPFLPKGEGHTKKRIRLRLLRQDTRKGWAEHDLH